MKKRDNIVSLGQIELKSTDFEITDPKGELEVLPTRDFVLFPGVTFPISLGRQSSIETAQRAAENETLIAIMCQREPEIESPRIPNDIYDYGVAARVVKVFDLPDGPKTAILHGVKKIHVEGKGSKPNTIKVEYIDEITPEPDDVAFQSLVDLVKETTQRILKKTGEGPNELSINMENVSDPILSINLICTHVPFKSEFKQVMLMEDAIEQRALLLQEELSRHEAMVDIAHEIQEKAKQNISESQKFAFLQNQMEAIRQELYGDDDDAETFRKRGAKTKFPDEVRSQFEREVDKLARLNPQSPDYAVQYSYLDLLLSLPWNNFSALNTDLTAAEQVLEADHYGLEKVKERIVEQLAVMMNNPEGRSPIICLVGAPGVGKTSLGQSIARAMGRKYQRVSLGGLHDESELRGHRKTYIGAMPGRIIDAMRRAGTSNPLLLLDEIDKIGMDGKSDPSAALLEVLDPEQNCHFHDNYVDVDYDLSNVLFIATANTLSTLSQPLLDRMEIIDISGYLQEEKVEIARRHLLPRVLKENGFQSKDITFTPEAIDKIIESYTSESGVRQLEKRIAAIVRKLVVRKMKGQRMIRTIKPAHVTELLGVEMHTRDRYEGNDYAGVVTGLAWTAVGGEILFIESSRAKGKGEKLVLTGNLGDVMKESAMIALQYVKSHANELNIDPTVFDTYNIHLHVPEGAIPKDGPSAGITMTTALASLLTGRKVRPRLAMTGEITLRGRVLPVGGIKEKILAAKRAGIDTIILSAENKKDVQDITEAYRQGLHFIYVTDMTEVLENALLDELAEKN